MQLEDQGMVETDRGSFAVAGWVLDILLGSSDFKRHLSKAVRLHLFAILRDAWQLRQSLQVSIAPHSSWS